MLNSKQLEKIKLRLNRCPKGLLETALDPVGVSLQDLAIVLDEIPEIVAESERRTWEEFVNQAAACIEVNKKMFDDPRGDYALGFYEGLRLISFIYEQKLSFLTKK